MSYVEKSVYKYITNILTSGIKALFNRKFLVYTIFFVVVVFATTLTFILDYFNVTFFGISSESLINYTFYFELAFSSSYILVGLLLAKLPQYIHVPLIVLIAGGLTTAFIFIDDLTFASIFGFVLYCLWIVITIVSAYSLSRNMFGSRVLGSILFMGKKEGAPSLFAGILTPLAITCIGLDIYILYQGIAVVNSWLYITVGVVGILMGLFTIYSIWVLARRDDVFYTILPFFYILANTHTAQMVLKLIQGQANYLSWGSVLLMAFFLLNSVSKYYRKVEKLDSDFLPKTEEDEKDKEEFFISDAFIFISDRGVITIVLGFAMAFHSMALQIGFKRTDVLDKIKLTGEIVQTGHCITLLFAAFMVIISVILYNSYKRFRDYSSSSIFRLSFLPPYEDLERFFKEAKAGEINWALFARDATVKAAKKGFLATAKVTVSMKERVVRTAKKGVIVVHEGTQTAVEKTKRWGGRIFRRKKKGNEGQLKPGED